MTKIKFVITLVITFIIAQQLNKTAHSLEMYAFVTLPGTFLHELMHYVLAFILGGNPGNFNLIPSGNTLGSITFTPNWYNAAAVGLAPLHLMPFTAFFAAVSAHSNNIFKMIGGGYLAACSWVACTPSSADLKLSLVLSSWPLAISIHVFTTWAVYKIVKIMIR